MGAEAVDRREGQTGLQPADRIKILVVDDQAENLLAAEAVLESLGQEVVRAQSGREALRRLLADDFAVILLDVMMPVMDGFETASLIRQRERSRTTPIIFITALGRSEEHIFRGYEVGAVDYLTKPVVPEILRSKVAVFVELARKNALLQHHAELLEKKNRELEEANAQIVRDGVAERIQLAVDFAQFHDPALQAVVQPVDLIFGAPELRVGILQLAVLLFE